MTDQDTTKGGAMARLPCLKDICFGTIYLYHPDPLRYVTWTLNGDINNEQGVGWINHDAHKRQIRTSVLFSDDAQSHAMRCTEVDAVQMVTQDMLDNFVDVNSTMDFITIELAPRDCVTDIFTIENVKDKPSRPEACFMYQDKETDENKTYSLLLPPDWQTSLEWARIRITPDAILYQFKKTDDINHIQALPNTCHNMQPVFINVCLNRAKEMMLDDCFEDWRAINDKHFDTAWLNHRLYQDMDDSDATQPADVTLVCLCIFF